METARLLAEDMKADMIVHGPDSGGITVYWVLNDITVNSSLPFKADLDKQVTCRI